MTDITPRPTLDFILDQLKGQIAEQLLKGAPTAWSFKLAPEDKVADFRDVDVTLEVLLQFDRSKTLDPTQSNCNTDHVVELLQSVFPPVWTYQDNQTEKAALTIESTEFILSELSLVAGDLYHVRSGPGAVMLYYKHGQVLFIKRGLH